MKEGCIRGKTRAFIKAAFQKMGGAIKLKGRTEAGVTLVELLISIAILILIAAMGYEAYTDWQMKNAIKLTAKSIEATLKRARSMSLASEDMNCYGVQFNWNDNTDYYDDKYEIIYYDTQGSGDCSDITNGNYNSNYECNFQNCHVFKSFDMPEGVYIRYQNEPGQTWYFARDLDSPIAGVYPKNRFVFFDRLTGNHININTSDSDDSIVWLESIDGTKVNITITPAGVIYYDDSQL